MYSLSSYLLKNHTDLAGRAVIIKISLSHDLTPTSPLVKERLQPDLHTPKVQIYHDVHRDQIGMPRGSIVMRSPSVITAHFDLLVIAVTRVVGQLASGGAQLLSETPGNP